MEAWLHHVNSQEPRPRMWPAVARERLGGRPAGHDQREQVGAEPRQRSRPALRQGQQQERMGLPTGQRLQESERDGEEQEQREDCE